MIVLGSGFGRLVIGEELWRPVSLEELGDDVPVALLGEYILAKTQSTATCD